LRLRETKLTVSHGTSDYVRGALGYSRNCKTEEKIIHNCKTAKQFAQNQKLHTKPSKNHYNGDKWDIQSKLH